MAHDNRVYCIISINDIDKLNYNELLTSSSSSCKKNSANGNPPTQFLISWSKDIWGEDVPTSVAAAVCISIDGRTVHNHSEIGILMSAIDWKGAEVE